jgi:hypothetical protein
MSDAQFVAAFSVVISMVFVLVIWRWMSGLRDDNLRDQLFTVRDQMFLYALDRGIADTPAHENLRVMLNSLIRYAHRVSLGRLMLLDISQRVFKIKPSPPATCVDWVKAIEALPSDEVKRMRNFHEQAMFLIMKHMITGSPLLWCAAGVVVFHFVVFKSTRVFIKSTRVFIDGIVRAVTRRVPSVDLFEVDASRTT